MGSLIEAGSIAQGIADAAMLAAGIDEPFPAEPEVAAVLRSLAVLVGHSWASGFTAPLAAEVNASLRALDAVDPRAFPEGIEIRRPEGYAHYALYPESYWEAALPVGPSPTARVIGIRSVGTSLGAVVAAALGAPMGVTVRPTGHPFERRIVASPALDAALSADPTAPRAIVDEGPGLSGSSFGAVADACEHRGIPPHNIVFFPSHTGDPGPRCTEAHRLRWRRSRRSVASFEDLLLRQADPARRLEGWFADITGPPEAPLQDIAGGRWRGRHATAASDPQPSDRQHERRKFLLQTPRGTFLLKYAGLGHFGDAKLARARSLAEAGFVLPPLALRHGFLLERWRGDLAPLPPRSTDRKAFLVHLARYLGFRARCFPADPSDGASMETLGEMARHNLAEALGTAAGTALARRLGSQAGLARPVHRVCTDNRLGAWEWLVTPGGTWVKTDALDHCAGHDLIGCQDIAWDVAGASIEFDLDPSEMDALRTGVGRECGCPCDPDLVRALRIAYAAFQLGAWSMARDRDVEEGPALARTVERYGAAARRLLEEA